MIIVNPTNGPLIYTDDARTIAAGERLTDVRPDNTTRIGLARGYLTEITLDASETPAELAAAPGVSDPEPAG